MTAREILLAMSESDELADEVLLLLHAAMWDEWDIGLPEAIQEGFGGAEFRIAARTGALMARA